MRRPCLPVLLLVGAAVLVGCSDDDPAPASASSASSSSSSAAPSSASGADASPAAVCTSIQELQASVSALADVPVREGGLDALRTAFTTVQEDAERVIEAARDQYADQSDQLRTDVSALQGALEEAASSPTATTLQAVGSAIATLSRDVTSFVDDVGSTC